MQKLKLPESDNLTASELEYVADMLAAIAFFKNEIGDASPQTIDELCEALRIAEAALRRTVSQIKSGPSACVQPN